MVHSHLSIQCTVDPGASNIPGFRRLLEQMWSEWKISESFWPGNNLHGGVIIISMVKIITNDKWPGEKCEMLDECCEPSMSSGKCQRRPPGDNHRHPLHHHHAWTDSSPLYNKIHYLDHDQTRFKTTNNFYESKISPPGSDRAIQVVKRVRMLEPIEVREDIEDQMRYQWEPEESKLGQMQIYGILRGVHQGQLSTS